MRKILVSLTMLLIATAMQAIPAKRGMWTTIVLEDGTKVRVEFRGDEYLHFWQAEDGTVYQKVSGTDKYVKGDLPAMREAVAERRMADMERRLSRRAVSKGPQKASYTGSKKGLIILVQFQNMQFQSAHDQDFYNRMANEIGFTHSEGYNGSVHDYFLAQSDGVFDLTFDVAGPYTMPNNYEYYGGDTPRKDYHVSDMVKKACQDADADVNFADYDWDGDGSVDQVYILYAGDNQAYQGSDENTIWPHESQLGSWGRIRLDNVYINTYACGSELQFRTYPGGIGTFCHEFSHCLGLMDMYDTDYEESGGEGYGMGSWSVMASGCDLSVGMAPCGYTAYEKTYCGWMEPVELTGEVSVTGMKALSEGGESNIIYNQGNRNEFYMLENRQKTGWDKSIPGAGLLITHIDYNSNTWRSNQINVNPNHQRFTVVSASNQTSNEITMTYPYRTNNKLTNTTTPAATTFNKNSDGQYFLSYDIYDIVLSDGLISFNGGTEKEKEDLNVPPIDPTDAIFYESFNQCPGTGGNDYFWSGAAIAVGSFKPDNEGWIYGKNAAKGGDRCARFGTSSVKGNARTPSFTIHGTSTFAFKAAPWGDDGTTLTLSVEGDGQLENTSFEMHAGQWTNIVTKLTGEGNVQVTFWPEGMLFLDEVIVKADEQTGIKSIDSLNSVPEGYVYNLQGCKVADNIDSSLPKGIYILNGKKIVIK